MKAREWFQMAVEQGDPVAQNNLGILYENGRGSAAQDLAKASQLYARGLLPGATPGNEQLGIHAS